MLVLKGRVVGRSSREVEKDGKRVVYHEVQVLSNGGGRAKLFNVSVDRPDAFKDGQPVELPVVCFSKGFVSWKADQAS